MIANEQALHDDFLPSDMIHRDGEINVVTTTLQSVAEGYSDELVGIFGPSGAGKTTLARYICDELEQEAPHVRVGEVNCMSHSSAHDALYHLLVSAEVNTPVQPAGLASTELLTRIRDSKRHVVAIFDEVDFLSDPGVLQSLHTLDTCSPVVITTDKRSWFSSLPNRILRRMRTATAVELKPYSHDQIRDILQLRADVGVDGRVTEDAMEQMAILANSDARYAIALLRHAAEFCTSLDTPSEITVDVVNQVNDDVCAALTRRYVERLATHPRVLYEIIREAGEIPADALREQYERAVADPRSDAQRRRYLQSLARYDLIEASGSTRDRRYRVC